MTSRFATTVAVTITVVLALACLAAALYGIEPRKVTVCELMKSPAAYNRQQIEVTAFVSHGFEDFTLFDPSCRSYPPVWIEYGGRVSSGTMYCCGVTAERSRREPLVIDNTPVTLSEDRIFQQFDRMVQRKPDSVVRATVIGRFFAARRDSGKVWAGYGHFGCCDLLAVERVVSVEAQEDSTLDLRASPDQPDIEGVGCGYRFLAPDDIEGKLISAQRNVEAANMEWPFTDPARVAAVALAEYAGIEAASIAGMKPTRSSPGRVIYEWRPVGRRAWYMVVVSRPYWMSFYSRDPKRVAWVVIAAYEASCR